MIFILFVMPSPDTHSFQNRRAFLKRSAVAGAFGLSSSWSIGATKTGVEGGAKKPLRFGVIADVHKDIMHDADDRLRVFVDEMTKENVDFVVQIGDFCVPKVENQDFLDIWNSFPGPRYHVLGNHDTDGGFERAQTVDWWKMGARYYSFDQGEIHFVVLDGNDRPQDHAGGYPRFIADDQLDWLRGDLVATEFTTVIFVHQSIERETKGGVQNGAAVRELLEEVNLKAGWRKVIACFSGHHHRDYVRQIKDIVYPQINSASYFWVGGDFLKVRYSDEIDAAHPYIKYTVPYKDPIFALVTIDLARGFMGIEGKRTAFVGPAPWEIGKDREYWDANTLIPGVSDWKMPVGI
jgi:predicted phosphodiesterase